MFICSTVLYFGEEPVGYDLHKTVIGFQLKPAALAEGEASSPVIAAVKAENDWAIAGTDDADVREQVVRLLGMQERLAPSGELSAAS